MAKRRKGSAYHEGIPDMIHAIVDKAEKEESALSMEIVCNRIGIWRSVIDKHEQSEPRLHHALLRVRNYIVGKVEGALFKSALAGNFNAQKFVLTNMAPHRWRERVENTHLHSVVDRTLTPEDRQAIREAVNQRQALASELSGVAPLTSGNVRAVEGVEVGSRPGLSSAKD